MIYIQSSCLLIIVCVLRIDSSSSNVTDSDKNTGKHCKSFRKKYSGQPFFERVNTYLLFSITYPCPDNSWKCRNKKCINEEFRCDGDNDCIDGSDEENCDHCQYDEMFHCKNKKCISMKKMCDGRNHCDDNGDEENCDPCPVKRFTCKNKKCIDLENRCDRSNDCGDNSDEENCAVEGVLCDFESGMCGWRYYEGKDYQRGTVIVCKGNTDCMDSPMLYYGFENKCIQFTFTLNGISMKVYTSDDKSTDNVFLQVHYDGHYYKRRKVNTLIPKREGSFQIKFRAEKYVRTFDEAHIDNILIANCSQ
ncbi:hypothetical protein Btru_043309, partial [Bulinus truncatus]